ncbi:protein PYRICULARIA ORYZAE RESISTANCE 21-like isoform X5 [Rhodamnia argentea]|uniref:Protein PYRICULARIA ORYZAE RESISTANCE 21-like isoform X5 n=1 Tax=Rhodamnia argentea TaxID=178133 RepID=A0ABM3H6Q7_9MYRT|nr:protein PYRICULARIA ORYZAE RESISTANCE 21-like isoform X5 [Rhodamnia argentea]
MAEKVTRMLIKVEDLQCCRCYKKNKKILCKFPQIQDQIYDEKRNEVLITVVCCSPKKIRQKIICKGGKTVKSVEILLDKPKEQEKPKEPEKKPEKLKELEKPKDPPKEPAKPPAPAPAPAPDPAPAPAPPPKPPEQAPPKPPQPPPQPLPLKEPEPVPGYWPVPMYPMVGVCWCPCYEGYGGGPCYYHGHGRPAMCYDGCGRLAYECHGGSRGYFVNRCDYFSEENPTRCTVM